MFYGSFTLLVHFWPPPIFNPVYACAADSISVDCYCKITEAGNN